MNLQKYIIQFIIVASTVYFITKNGLSNETILYIALVSMLGFVLLDNITSDMLEGFPGIKIANCVATAKKEAGLSNVTIERPTEPPKLTGILDRPKTEVDANNAAHTKYAIDLKAYQDQFKDSDKNTRQLRADCCESLGLTNDPACNGGGGGGDGNPGNMSHDAWCSANPYSASCQGIGRPAAGTPAVNTPAPGTPEPETTALETTAPGTPPATTPGKTKVVVVDVDCPWYKWITFQC
jgi:hypothetical protein